MPHCEKETYIECLHENDYTADCVIGNSLIKYWERAELLNKEYLPLNQKIKVLK